MGLSSRQFLNNPTLNGNTIMVQLAAAVAPASLRAAIDTAAGGSVTGITGVLISASTGNNVFLGGTVAGTGILIPSGQNMFLPIESGNITYESGATTCACMVFIG